MSYESIEPCIVCGMNYSKMVCYHHIYTRKARPEFENEDWNKIPVCQKHHNEFHSKGTHYMSQKYDSVAKWLKMYDWNYDSFLLKWTHE